MNFTLAIAHNRDALLRVLAMLVAAAGMGSGGSVTTLPRHLRATLLRVLRPAESAVRRLIVVAAQGLSVSATAVRTAPPVGAIPAGTGQRVPVFALLDPLQRVGVARPKYCAGPGPRLSFFDGTDPVVVSEPIALPDDPIDAARLCRRLAAVKRALDNLPRQAKRLARWRARLAQQAKPRRTRSIRPGRPPGHRARGRHPVDAILAECQTLALLVAAPDTS